MPWKPGQSGNPAGRPPVDNPIQKLARQYAPEAIRTAVRIMRSARSYDSSRLGAIGVILERAYGKPKQELDVSHGRKASEMSDDEIAERLAAIAARRGRAGIAGDDPAPGGDPRKLQ